MTSGTPVISVFHPSKCLSINYMKVTNKKDAFFLKFLYLIKPCRNCILVSDIRPQNEKVFNLAQNDLAMWIQLYVLTRHRVLTSSYRSEMILSQRNDSDKTDRTILHGAYPFIACLHLIITVRSYFRHGLT